MSGIYNTINIGLSGLLAYRQAIDVRAHNVANVATEGYRRQEAVLCAIPGLPFAGNMNALVGGQWGAGVQALSVRHSHESFLDLQARLTDATLGRWGAVSGTLHQVEVILQPAPGEDLSAQLDRFWNAWETVAGQPEDVGARYALRQQAVALANGFHSAEQQIQAIRTTTDTTLRGQIAEVNTLTAEIAELSRIISVALAEARAPNDNLDRRDVLLDRLAQLTGAMPFTSEGGDLIVYLDGRPLIQGSTAHSLSLEATATGIEIRTSYDDGLVAIGNGEIGGVLYARDVCIPGYLQQLDDLAAALTAEVNALHQTGFGLDNATGRDFFVPGGAAGTIAVDPLLLANVDVIAAAAAADSPGDGSIALQIANLRYAPVLAGRSLDEFAQGLLGLVGEDVRTADSALAAHTAAREQIRQQQQSISGVSTDEEMAYLMELQRAYQAAARIIQAGDEMLRIVIERLGVS